MRLEKFIEKAKQLRVLGVKITQNGKEIGCWLAEDEMRRNIYSGTKSYVSFAVGRAVQEGLLSLDEKLTDVFADELPETVSENLQKATVRDLLTMRLGQATSELMASRRTTLHRNDWVRYSLSLPFPSAPGEAFVYSNVGPYLAGVLVQRRAGCTLTDYLMPRLFQPLGIQLPTWELDPLGNSFGGSGLMLTMSEYHKLGLLYLQKGVWQGKRLIAEKWVEESGKALYTDGPGYGYLFWRGEYNSYRADGMHGQLCIIFPDHNAVVTTVSESRDPQSVLRAIYDEICPQF